MADSAWPGAPARGRAEQLEVHGRNVALLRFGPERPVAGAVPVLCLHGWLDNAHSFVPLARALPDLALIAVDLPGHGHSAHRPEGAAYHQLDWIVDTLDIADALGLSRFALMGHSMGAGIAALTAGTAPERVQRLVMLEGTGPRATEPVQTVEKLRGHLEARAVAARAAVNTRGGEFATAVRARMTYSDPLERSSAELLCERGVRGASRGVTFGHDRRLQAQQPNQLSEAQVCAFLAAIRCPTQLVLASDGLALDPAVVDGRRAAFQDLSELHLPGGHHVHMDDAEAVAEVVGPFLRAGR